MKTTTNISKTLFSVALVSSLLWGAGADAQWQIPNGGVPLHGNLNGAQVETELAITAWRDGVIYAWRDSRPGSVSQDVYAQKTDMCGNLLWGANGLMIIDANGNQDRVQVVADSTDGAYILWRDAPNDDIRIQHVDGSGTKLWAATGIRPVTNVTDDIRNPVMTTDGFGGIILAWEDGRPSGFSGSWDAYAQRIDPQGNLLWGADGVAIGTEDANQVEIALASDSTGGAFFSWDDNRPVTQGIDVYANYVDDTGGVHWGSAGLSIASGSQDQSDSDITFTGMDNGLPTAMFAYRDLAGTGTHIMASKYYSDQSLFAGWQVGGDTVGSAITSSGNPGNAQDPRGVTDKAGGAYITYKSPYGSSDNDVLSVHMLSDGSWGPCTNSCSSQMHRLAFFTNREEMTDVVADGLGSHIAVWEWRDSPDYIRSRSHNDATYTAVTPTPTTGNRHAAKVDAACGHVYYVWEDNGAAAQGTDIYAGASHTTAPPPALLSDMGSTCSTCCLGPTSFTICEGDQLMLTAARPSGLFDTFTFYDGATVMQTGNNKVYTTTSLAAGTYNFTVVASTSLGCLTESSNQITVTVDPTPAAPTVTADAQYCEGDTLTNLSATGTTGTINWYDDAGLTNMIGTGSSHTPGSTVGVTTYYANETLGACPGPADSAVITIYALPTITVASAEDSVCSQQDQVALTGNPSGGTFSGTAVSGSTFLPQTAGAGVHMITYTYTDGNNCTNVDSVAITVLDCTGLPEYSPVTLLVYPNPSSGSIQIQMSRALKGRVEVMDATGRLVHSNSFSMTGLLELDLTDLSSGSYFLKIYNDEVVANTRIVIE